MLNESRVKHYLTLAERASVNSDNKKATIGCVLMYRGSVLAKGYNTEDKTNPEQYRLNPLRGYNVNESNSKSTTHAEMMCMQKVRYLDIDFSKVNLFVYRCRKDGSVGLARPCEACMAKAKEMGIRNIYFTTNYKDGWSYERI